MIAVLCLLTACDSGTPSSPEPFEGLDGSWDNHDVEMSLTTDASGGFVLYDAEGEISGGYIIDEDEGSITIEGDNGASYSGSIDSDGDISFGAFDGYFVKTESISYKLSDNKGGTTDDGDTSPIGAWDNDEAAVSIVFDDEGVFTLSDEENELRGTYTHEFLSGEIVLESGDLRSTGNTETVDGSVIIIIDDYIGSFYRVFEPYYVIEDGQGGGNKVGGWLSDATDTLVGMWDNNDVEMSLQAHSDGSFTLYDTAGETDGTYTFDSDSGNLTLVTNGGDSYHGYYDSDGDISLNDYAGYFWATDSLMYTGNGGGTPSTTTSTPSTATDGERIYIQNVWSNDDERMSIHFYYDSGGVMIYTEQESVRGEYTFDEAARTVEITYSGNTYYGSFDAEASLFIEGMDGKFTISGRALYFPIESINSDAFVGTWRPDESLDATFYVVVDNVGNWTAYDKSSGSAINSGMIVESSASQYLLLDNGGNEFGAFFDFDIGVWLMDDVGAFYLEY